jgi:hypothetical protein
VQVLGDRNGQTFSLTPGTTLELGFRCGAILETGGTSGSIDFNIIANVPAGGRAVIAISPNGAEWFELTPMTGSDHGADLGEVNLNVARYVRITNDGTTPIDIDAVIPVRQL